MLVININIRSIDRKQKNNKQYDVNLLCLKNIFFNSFFKQCIAKLKIEKWSYVTYQVIITEFKIVFSYFTLDIISTLFKQVALHFNLVENSLTDAYIVYA